MFLMWFPRISWCRITDLFLNWARSWCCKHSFTSSCRSPATAGDGINSLWVVPTDADPGSAGLRFGGGGRNWCFFNRNFHFLFGLGLYINGTTSLPSFFLFVFLFFYPSMASFSSRLTDFRLKLSLWRDVCLMDEVQLEKKTKKTNIVVRDI